MMHFLLQMDGGIAQRRHQTIVKTSAAVTAVDPGAASRHAVGEVDTC